MQSIWAWRFAGYTDEALKLAYHLSKDDADSEHHLAAKEEIKKRARAYAAASLPTIDQHTPSPPDTVNARKSPAR